MAIIAPFFPRYGTGQNLTATTTSQSVSIPTGNKQLCITVDAGAGSVFLRVTSGASTATLADYEVLGGMQSIISINEAADTVSYRTATGSTGFNIITGEGM